MKKFISIVTSFVMLALCISISVGAVSETDAKLAHSTLDAKIQDMYIELHEVKTDIVVLKTELKELQELLAEMDKTEDSNVLPETEPPIIEEPAVAEGNETTFAFFGMAFGALLGVIVTLLCCKGKKK